MSSVALENNASTSAPIALVVEDDALERLRLVTLLERAGYRVVAADDGAQGLADLAVHRPDVVVTDWQLPAVSGVQLCRAAQTVEAGMRPFTMLVTARDDVADLVEALESGADDFISKPYRSEELLARIHAGHRLARMRRELAHRGDMLELALRRQQALRQTLHDDLASAAILQQEMLGRYLPTVAGLDMAHLFRPAQSIGGDLFGVIPRGAGIVFFHIDAVGHGVAAALQGFSIAVALGPLCEQATLLEDPANWVRGLHGRAAGGPVELSCGLVAGSLDLITGAGRLCQAGFPHPLIVTRAGRLRRLGRGGPSIGSLRSSQFESVDFRLEAGERLVLCSDGAADMVNPMGQVFGQERLEQVLQDHASLPLAEFTRVASRQLDEWRSHATLQDDISLLALARVAA